MNTQNHSREHGIRTLLKAAPYAAWVLAAAVMLSMFACNKGPKESPQEKATREIMQALVIPPDCTLRHTDVKTDLDTMLLQYGTNQKIDDLVKFYKQQLMEKKYQTVALSDSGVTYRDNNSRSVTVMWFARDPDLSQYKTAISVAVTPLPPALKKPAK